MFEARTLRTTSINSNHRSLLLRAGFGLYCLGLVLACLGCAETQPRATTVPQDPCNLSPSPPTLEDLQQENERLRQQIDALSGLPEGIGVSDLYQVAEVQLTRYTGLYDRDKDGQVDQLCVYLKPVDAEGDVVKAAGDATVQLWDLSGNQSEALLKEWEIPSEQLRKEWFSSLMTVNYRLLFPLQAEWTDPSLALTVRVQFKDYLTGQKLTAQTPVKKRS